MITTVVTFSTTTAAMKMEKNGEGSRISGKTDPDPVGDQRPVRLAWKCVEQSEEEAEVFLKEKELAWDGIYRVLA